MRLLRDIRRDLRRTWALAAVSAEMKDRGCEDYFIREARALESELSIRVAGVVMLISKSEPPAK